MITWLIDWLAYKQWKADYYMMSGRKSVLTFKEFLAEYKKNESK